MSEQEVRALAESLAQVREELLQSRSEMQQMRQCILQMHGDISSKETVEKMVQDLSKVDGKVGKLQSGFAQMRGMLLVLVPVVLAIFGLVLTRGA